MSRKTKQCPLQKNDKPNALVLKAFLHTKWNKKSVQKHDKTGTELQFPTHALNEYLHAREANGFH